MKTTIQGVKGARDFYPEDMAIRQWLYRAIRRVSERFGYQEWDGPFLEKIDLYAAKSGEELVNQQAFVFNRLNWPSRRAGGRSVPSGAMRRCKRAVRVNSSSGILT